MRKLYYYQRLKDLREDRDLTQKEIAEVLGTAREQYNKYELGRQEIPFHHVIRLAKFYHVTLVSLAGLIETPRKLK